MAGRCPDPDNVRPNPPLGTYYHVPLDHEGERTGPNPHMLAAYRFPPSTHYMPDRSSAYLTPYPAFFPGSYIGPVVGVDHTPTRTAVLINQHWVTVWTCRPAAPPALPAPTLGIHHLRPAPAALVRSWAPTNQDPWDPPFHALSVLSPDLGISHVSAPGTRHSLPQFLITGAAWFRLHQVREYIRLRLEGDRLLRDWRELSMSDRQALARTLHNYLDYPPTSAGPTRHSALRTAPRALGLTLILLPVVWPRARIMIALRRWIWRRRAARVRERSRLIYADRLFPPPILALEGTVHNIAAYL